MDGEDRLRALGLRPGATVRFRRRGGERWQLATVVDGERDGSVGLRDARGRRRAIPVELIEVREPGPRGGRGWTPLTEVAARTEQLGLWDA